MHYIFQDIENKEKISGLSKQLDNERISKTNEDKECVENTGNVWSENEQAEGSDCNTQVFLKVFWTSAYCNQHKQKCEQFCVPNGATEGFNVADTIVPKIVITITLKLLLEEL